jgi:DNA-binding MarR family transcriptional regulator
MSKTAKKQAHKAPVKNTKVVSGKVKLVAPLTQMHKPKAHKDMQQPNKPILSGGKSSALLVHNARQLLTLRFEAATEGLTLTQYEILHAITAFKMPSQTDICEYTGIDRSTVADVMRRMSDAGWVERARRTDDARAYTLILTAKGGVALKSGVEALATIENMVSSVDGYKSAMNWAKTFNAKFGETDGKKEKKFIGSSTNTNETVDAE